MAAPAITAPTSPPRLPAGRGRLWFDGWPVTGPTWLRRRASGTVAVKSAYGAATATIGAVMDGASGLGPSLSRRISALGRARGSRAVMARRITGQEPGIPA